MKRLYLAIASFLAVALPLFSQGGQNFPLSFDSLTKDMGTVFEGQKLKHVFQFTNRGAYTIQILGVEASCGCTSALLSDRELAAGQSGRIEVLVDTTGKPGALNKTVTVITDDPRQPQIILTILARVEQELSASPPSFYFGNNPKGKEVSKEILITVQSSQPVELLSVDSNNPGIVARLEPIPESDGKKFKLVATQKGDIKEGYFNGEIVIKTNSRTTPKLTIPARGVVSPAQNM